ncbi:sialidase precursor, partial [Trypanosoma rangeli]
VYRCVNANVTNAERVPNGLKFNGVGGGAVWPVARQGQTRRYQFANYRFTLVATVTIDALPKDASPVLGAGLEGPGDTKLLGLSYDKNRQWQPLYGAAPVSPTGSWELHKKYHVVLTMADRQGSVYVDGQSLAGSGNTIVRGATLPDISHFYIGGPQSNGAPTDSRVTVTNVLLYNRRLSAGEIRTLFLSQDMIGTDGDAGNAA